MRKSLLILSVALGLLIADSDQSRDVSVGQESKKSPVDNWAGWWPDSQFDENSRVSADGLVKLPRTFQDVRYPSISTKCGTPWVTFSHLEDEGLRLDLVWSGPGTSASKEEWEKTKTPEVGDVQAAIVRNGKVVRESREEPAIMAWVGGSLGTSGNMIVTFDFLPADFDDYWFRVDVKGDRFWFLIPYGLGSDPAKNGNIQPVERGAPSMPVGANEEDKVLDWSAVHYDLFHEEANNNFHVSVVMTNNDYSRAELELYRERDRWTLHTPRTSATYLWPGGYTRFASLFGLRRDYSYRRWDHFQFFHHGHDIRSWGVLRVTVEDKAVDVCIPSSLSHAWHGKVQ